MIATVKFISVKPFVMEADAATQLGRKDNVTPWWIWVNSGHAVIDIVICDKLCCFICILVKGILNRLGDVLSKTSCRTSVPQLIELNMIYNAQSCPIAVINPSGVEPAYSGYSGRTTQYHCCWYTGSVHGWVVNKHGINSIGAKYFLDLREEGFQILTQRPCWIIVPFVMHVVYNAEIYTCNDNLLPHKFYETINTITLKFLYQSILDCKLPHIHISKWSIKG